MFLQEIQTFNMTLSQLHHLMFNIINNLYMIKNLLVVPMFSILSQLVHQIINITIKQLEKVIYNIISNNNMVKAKIYIKMHIKFQKQQTMKI